MAAVLPPNQAWVPHTQPAIHKRAHSQTSSAVSFQDQPSKRETEQVPALSHSIKIKPYLRKLSLRDNSNNLDLSRPTAENESLAGLGFYDESRSGSDLAFSPVSSSRSRHQRTTSNTSTFSTSSSSHQRPTAPFAQPFRHTPRPYTPPISRSYTASSLLSSDDSGEADDIMVQEDFRSRQRAYETARRSGSIGSLPAAPQAIHMHSSSSLTRLNASNTSQSSLPSMPTSRSRGDTMRSIDTMHSSSRTSMDKAMHMFRGASTKDEPIDPATRAAHIMAARLAYAEREEAKERKAEKELLKQQDKENRKRQHKEERKRRQSEGSSGRPSHSMEKLQFVGKSYDEYTPAHTRTLPKHVPTTPTTATIAPSSRPERSTRPSSTRSMKSRWLGFLAWFRTRLLRVRRQVRGRN